jgi:uncharacterized membrane protein
MHLRRSTMGALADSAFDRDMTTYLAGRTPATKSLSTSTPRSSRMFSITLAAVVGTGAMGGVFFAFSSFVMAGLHRLPPAEGLAAMQSINVTAVRPVFMGGLFGTALLCVILFVSGLRSWHHSRSVLLLAGSALYLLGAIVLTAAYHVPLNDSLAKLDPHGLQAADQWNHYVTNWTLWNHVRAGASLAAAACFALALAVPDDSTD